MVAHLRYREIKIRKKMENRTEIKRVESQTFLMNHFPLSATFALAPFPFWRYVLLFISQNFGINTVFFCICIIQLGHHLNIAADAAIATAVTITQWQQHLIIRTMLLTQYCYPFLESVGIGPALITPVGVNRLLYYSFTRIDPISTIRPKINVKRLVRLCVCVCMEFEAWPIVKTIARNMVNMILLTLLCNHAK